MQFNTNKSNIEALHFHLFTCYNHHADRKYFLIIRFSSDVSESNTSHASHRVVQSGHVPSKIKKYSSNWIQNIPLNYILKDLKLWAIIKNDIPCPSIWSIRQFDTIWHWAVSDKSLNHCVWMFCLFRQSI